MRDVNTGWMGKKFHGKEFWRTLNLIMFFALYAVFLIVPLIFPEYIWTVAVIVVFVILIYIAVQQAVYRKMEQKNAGRRVLTGWIDEEEDLGEEYEIPIKKIAPFDRLSESDQKAVDTFMELEKQRITNLGMREERIGLTNFELNKNDQIVNAQRKIDEQKKIKHEKVVEVESEEVQFDEDEIEEYNLEDEDYDEEEE